MRLIDADELVKFLKGCTMSNGTLINTNTMLAVIEKMPTVCDIENIVKDIEEKTEFLKDCTKYGNESVEQQEKSYSTMMMYEVADLVDDLIDIVRKGGVNG